MPLNLAHKTLGWPDPNEIFKPSGSGPRINAQLVKDKIGQNIRNSLTGGEVELGILTPNSKNDGTESPLAIVCKFSRPVSDFTLREAHKLAWNFSAAPLLIFVEPHSIKAWTCCEDPSFDFKKYPDKPEITQLKIDSNEKTFLSYHAAKVLHWVNLVTGDFFKKNENRFKRKSCADLTLLGNLRYVREVLLKRNLVDDTAHDLLARLIFIQFLFHRKDSSGNPALHSGTLDRLYRQKVLTKKYGKLEDILQNYRDSYALFRWLSEKFNGDLFPGNGANKKEQEKEWKQEMKLVKSYHLQILSEFVSGTMKMDTGQRSLWPHYQFDAIPLEFISSIYEIFVSKKNGAVYTPGHIVDFMLDGVLPWNHKNWDLKILDPACGSGVFLVKAFKRLIHRWKLAFPKRNQIGAEVLKGILENNIFGIDNDPHAVRVASFSLYLTMCDEIDPKQYWTNVKFPRLREKSLIYADFFDESKGGFQSEQNKASYDLILGNPPWGKGSISRSPFAINWAEGRRATKEKLEETWEYANKDIGTLFLPKAATLTKPDGQISLLQSAMGMIFNQLETSRRFRKKFFNSFRVNEIVNLSALRFGLFKKALSPACIVTFQPLLPGDDPISYICPKPLHTREDDYRIIIEPHDINIIFQHEAANDDIVWTALMWGGKRDLAFMRRLIEFENISTLKEKGIAKSVRGIERGDRKKAQNFISGKRMLKADKFPEGTFYYLEADRLPINRDTSTHSKASTNFDAFQLPQLLLKRSWQKKTNRFQAAIVKSKNKTQGILCSKSYVSINVKKENPEILDMAWLVFNSKLAVYFLFLSSGTFASYIPSMNVKDLLGIPIPKPKGKKFEKDIDSIEEVDDQIRELFGFKESEWILIEDLFNYTLPDKEGGFSPGRTKTYSKASKFSARRQEPCLENYCLQFLKIMKATFGSEKYHCATIFQEEKATLPVRLVAIHFDWPGRDLIHIEQIDSEKMLLQLMEIYQKTMELPNHETFGVCYQRILKIYDSIELNNQKRPSLFLIKPDQTRYWTKSIALRDADEVATDILIWNQNNKERPII